MLSTLIYSPLDAVTSGILSSLAEGLALLHSRLQAAKRALPMAAVEGGVSQSNHEDGCVWGARKVQTGFPGLQQPCLSVAQGILTPLLT